MYRKHHPYGDDSEVNIEADLDELYGTMAEKLFPNKPYRQFYDELSRYFEWQSKQEGEEPEVTTEIDITYREDNLIKEALDNDPEFRDKFLDSSTIYALFDTWKYYEQEYHKARKEVEALKKQLLDSK